MSKRSETLGKINGITVEITTDSDGDLVYNIVDSGQVAMSTENLEYCQPQDVMEREEFSTQVDDILTTALLTRPNRKKK